MKAFADTGFLCSLYAPDAHTVAAVARVKHSEILGTRSLDILHVATALVLGLHEFLTFDRRQHALAVAAGISAPVLG